MAAQAAQYYEVSGDVIDLIPVVGCAVNMPGMYFVFVLELPDQITTPPGMFLAIYTIDRFGVKVGKPEKDKC